MVIGIHQLFRASPGQFKVGHVAHFNPAEEFPVQITGEVAGGTGVLAQTVQHDLVEGNRFRGELEAVVLIGNFGHQIHIGSSPEGTALHAHGAKFPLGILQHLLVVLHRLRRGEVVSLIVIEGDVLAHALKPDATNRKGLRFLGKSVILLPDNLGAEKESFFLSVGQDCKVGQIHNIVAPGVSVGLLIRLHEISRQGHRGTHTRCLFHQRGELLGIADSTLHRQAIREAAVAALRPALEGELHLLHTRVSHFIQDLTGFLQRGDGTLGIEEQTLLRRGHEQVDGHRLLAHIGRQSAVKQIIPVGDCHIRVSILTFRHEHQTDRVIHFHRIAIIGFDGTRRNAQIIEAAAILEIGVHVVDRDNFGGGVD